MTKQEQLEENARQSAWQVGLEQLPPAARQGVERGIALGILQRDTMLAADRIVTTVIDKRDSTVAWSFEIARNADVPTLGKSSGTMH